MLKSTEFEIREGLFPLDYYYGDEAEQFSFVRLPKILFTDPAFKTLSGDAKILYGLLLDRMSLSIRNGWLDEENRVYIFYTLEEATEDLGCGTTKGVSLFAELDKCGLIERKKQGMGKPTMIYVKNFIRKDPTQAYGYSDPPKERRRRSEDEAAPQEESPETRATTEGVKTSKKWKSRLPESGSQDFQKMEVKTFKNRKSRLSENESQDFQKTKANNTDKNYTDRNDTEYLSVYPGKEETFRESGEDQTDATDTMDELRNRIRENIEYDALCEIMPEDQDRIDGIVELITDVVASPGEEVRIGGISMNRAIVEKRLLSLQCEDVQYVLERMNHGSAREIRNIRAYLLTSLYNAPVTSAEYSNAEVARFWPRE